MQSTRKFAGIGLLLASALLTAADQATKLPSSPGDLVKSVIQNELNVTAAKQIRWKYVVSKQTGGATETRQVIETDSGPLERLLAVAGKPLSSEQQHDEAQRILKLSNNPADQKKLEESRAKDAQQSKAFLQMIPAAFLFEYADQSAELVKVTFKPNPQFSAPSREGKVLKEMQGEMWIDVNQLRLVNIRGQLVNEVRFAGGLLGHLEKGGQFSVRRREIVPGDWELTELMVSMRGKALSFKSICVQQQELHSKFERVPDRLTLSQAAQLLLNQNVKTTQAVLAGQRAPGIAAPALRP